MNSRFFSKIFIAGLFSLSAQAFSEEVCDEATMDAFAYEDCIAAKKKAAGPSTVSSQNESAAKVVYNPFGKDAYLTSSFGENRGTRYHMGIDYSTEMKEGWVVYAPEDGTVKELKTSPYGYGKVMYYKGKSGKIWVFAHQSSFGPKLDPIVSKKMYSTQKNDISVTPGTAFKKGDTLTFTGSSGIGAPHLHLEVRTADNKGLSPCGQGVLCLDTIAPQIFGAAAWFKNDVSFTSADVLAKGCLETPIKDIFKDDSPIHVAFKIADYSRTPKDNPMSVRRVELKRSNETIYKKLQDEISFNNQVKIRDELLWAEEADTAGDWHYIDAALPPQSKYTLEVEDYAGHVTKRNFSLKSSCAGNQPFEMTHFQTTPLFSYLSRPLLDLSKCDNGYSFATLDQKGTVLSDNLCSALPHKPTFLGKVSELYPATAKIKYRANGAENEIFVYTVPSKGSSLSWNMNAFGAEISQKISGLTYKSNDGAMVLAFTKIHTDSLDYFEFHPKGVQFSGSWEVCLDANTAKNPLYWLGETGRTWNYFSKQTGGKKRCASVNEIRDIASIDNKQAPVLGMAYWGTTIVEGRHLPALKIPVYYKYSGLANGNAINVKYQKKWIAAEYDSEPREIIIVGNQLPEDGEEITVDIVDEAGNKATYEVVIPGM